MSGSDKQFQYSINGLKKGDKLTCVFTYNKGNAQYDTSEMTYVTGSTSSTDANIQAPFGLVVNSPKDNTVSVVWDVEILIHTMYTLTTTRLQTK